MDGGLISCDNSHILIWNLKDKVYFELNYDIKCSSGANCVLETDHDSLFAAFSNENLVKFYERNNNFKESKTIENVCCMSGNDVACVINPSLLCLAHEQGFYLIDTHKKELIQFFETKETVFSFLKLKENSFLSCVKNALGVSFFVQYVFDEEINNFCETSRKYSPHNGDALLCRKICGGMLVSYGGDLVVKLWK